MPPPPLPTVERLNRRYTQFVPGSSKLDEVGIIIHGIDTFEDLNKPWRACSKHDPRCDFLSDRVSASIIYQGKPGSFTSHSMETNNCCGSKYDNAGSYVLNPFHTRFMCVYGGDGATRGKNCRPNPGVSKSCIPACITEIDPRTHNAKYSYERWCTSTTPTDHWCEGRPWRPEQVGKMLERDRNRMRRGLPEPCQLCGYNEVMVDGFYHNAQLPHAIEAWVVGPTDDQTKARRLHKAFLAEYGLTTSQVPFLVYNAERDASGDVFRLS